MEGETVIAGVDTHKDVHVLCLLCSGGLACADSPYWLVSYYHLGKFFCRKIEDGFYLSTYNLIKSAVLAFFKHFAYTENRFQPVGKCHFYLGEELFVVLSEILAAFAMADDDILSCC